MPRPSVVEGCGDSAGPAGEEPTLRGSPRRLRGRPARFILVSTLVAACAAEPPDVATQVGRIVYGTEDRREYFAVDDPTIRSRVAMSMVALVPRRSLGTSGGGLATDLPTWRQKAELCPGEPFSDQPVAAFCTGVLVDWDLVLTAGHCALVLAPRDFVAVFGYFYLEPGKLAVTAADIYDVEAIVSESLPGSDDRPRPDYAWLKLDRPVEPPREPAPVRRSVTGVERGSPLVFVGSGGGVPMKIDDGAAVFDPGHPWYDRFVANTDSAKGASGGAAFDRTLRVVGTLTRGASDFEMSERGCRVTVRKPEHTIPEEQFTFSARALEGLCARNPTVSSLCRPTCGDPCNAEPLPSESSGGCSAAPRHRPSLVPLSVVVGALMFATTTRRRRRSAGHHSFGTRFTGHR